MLKALILALLIVLVGIVSNKSHAGDSWDKTDKVLATGAVGLLIVDWGQTRYIAKNPEKHSEMNPILGDHPSVGRVDAYFALATLGTIALAEILPRDYRKLFLSGVIGLELGVVARNHHLGIRVAF